jgi:hypothetical protein
MTQKQADKIIGNGAGSTRQTDPEVVPKAKRRTFTAGAFRISGGTPFVRAYPCGCPRGRAQGHAPTFTTTPRIPKEPLFRMRLFAVSAAAIPIMKILW